MFLKVRAGEGRCKSLARQTENLKSQNHFDWDRPLRSYSTAINLTLPSPSTATNTSFSQRKKRYLPWCIFSTNQPQELTESYQGTLEMGHKCRAPSPHCLHISQHLLHAAELPT